MGPLKWDHKSGINLTCGAISNWDQFKVAYLARVAENTTNLNIVVSLLI